MAATTRPLAHVLRHIRNLAGEKPAQSLDAQLLDRFVRQRDDAAFAELVARHGPLVLGVAQRWLADRHEADDVVQSTFLALARQAKRLDRRKPLSGWLYTVAFRLARKAQAQSSRRTRVIVSRKDSVDPLADITGRELTRALDEELSKLPERYRVPLLLCSLDGLTRDEAAARLGLNLGALRGRLERGREMLRKRLEARGLTLPLALAGVLVADGAAALSSQLVAAVTKAALAVPVGAGLGSVKIAALVGVLLVAMGTGAGLGLRGDEKGQEKDAAKPPVAVAPDSPRVDAVGDPLPEGAVLRLGTLRFRAEDNISNICIQPKSQQVIFCAGPEVFVMNVANGQVVKRIGDFPKVKSGDAQNGFMNSTVTCSALAMAPDGRTFSVSGAIGAKAIVPIWICDSATGERLRSFAGHEKEVRGLAYLDDGRQLASFAHGVVRLWDVVTRAQIRELTGPDRTLTSFAASPDGKLIVTGGETKDGVAAIFIWSATNGKLIRTLSGHTANVQTVVFSPDGKMLASGGNATIRLWDVANGRELRQLQGHAKEGLRAYRHAIRSLAFSPDGNALASASTDGSVRVWSAENGRLLDDIPQFTVLPHTLAFRDNRTLLIGAFSTLRMRDIIAKSFVNADAGAVVNIGFVGYSTNGATIVTADTDSTIHLWDARNGQHRLAKQWSLHTAITIVSLDGRLCAFSEPNGDSHDVCIGDLSTGQVVRRLPRGDWCPMIFGRGGKHLFTRPMSRPVSDDELTPTTIWDVETGKQRGQVQTGPGHIRGLALSPDGRFAYTAEIEKAIRKWDLATGKALHQFSLGPKPLDANAIAVSPGGRRVAAACHDDAVRLFDTTTGRLSWQVDRKGRTHPEVIEFSPDGTLIAVGYNSQVDRQIDLWDARSGQHLAALNGHGPRNVVIGLAFSPDSSRLVSGGNHSALVWDIPTVTGRRRGGALDDVQQEQLWNDLGGTDATIAHAIDRWLIAPKAAGEYLHRKLRPAIAVSSEQVAPIVAAIDSPVFVTREQACKQLASLGVGAEAIVRKSVTRQPSAEVRKRLEGILLDWDRETLRAIRAVEILEHIATPAAREHLKLLAGGAPGARLTDAAAAALKRLGK